MYSRARPKTWCFLVDANDCSTVPTTAELPAMKLVSVNLSIPKEIVHDNKHVMTGIFKTPAVGRVMLRRLNLKGDGQGDLWGHGGAIRAVYVY